MSDITLCLITKGREEYLDALLESFDKVLAYKNVNVLVLLNGVKPALQERYSKWALSFPEQVTLHAFEVNDVRLSRFWHLIQGVKTEWISFPSDDDVLNASFFDDWTTFQEKFSDSEVVACSMNLIDYEGSELGIVRKPTFSPNLSKVEIAAKAFNECPFLWPALVIRTNALPLQSTNARYVADWTIGLSLIFSQKVAVESRSLINYRVHDGQESMVSLMSRKNFEALLHFDHFLNGSVFSEWVMALSSTEIVTFFDLLIKYPPIYGDPIFSAEFVGVLTRRISAIRNEDEVWRNGLLTNAYAHQVLMSSSELKFLVPTDDFVDSKTTEVNFSMNFSSDTCENLRDLKFDYRPYLPGIQVLCKHSKNGQDGAYVDCSKLGSDLMDDVLFRCHSYLEASDQFNFSISPFEVRLIRLYRLLKTWSPKMFSRFAHKLIKCP